MVNKIMARPSEHQTPKQELQQPQQQHQQQQQQQHHLQQQQQNQQQQDAQDTRNQPQVDHHQQAASDSNANKPKRNPFCSRCRNHGKSAQVKGHKRHCEYRNCQCSGCQLVEARQLVSAAQIKRRRYQRQDEESGRRIEVSPPVLKPSSSVGPLNINALRLFRFNPLLTGIPYTRLQETNHLTAAVGQSGLPGGSSPWMRSPSPPPSHQLQLATDIFNTCGPLAIYAWLRAEHFNMTKVRDLIELSKASYDEMSGNSPVDLTNPIVD